MELEEDDIFALEDDLADEVDEERRAAVEYLLQNASPWISRRVPLTPSGVHAQITAHITALAQAIARGEHRG